MDVGPFPTQVCQASTRRNAGPGAAINIVTDCCYPMVEPVFRITRALRQRTLWLLLLAPGTAMALTPPSQPASLAEELLVYPVSESPAPSTRPTSDAMDAPEHPGVNRNRGITAGFLSYDIGTSYGQLPANHSDHRYNANLTLGFNAGSWRLRHTANTRQENQQSSQYGATRSYAQRDLEQLNSYLTLGQYATPGELFEGVNFDGIQLRSDDQMRPRNQRGYAPVIRGMANTPATVTVMQQGSVIYETKVSPGEFIIDDLISPGNSGDLDVSVQEEDGTVRSFSVPYHPDLGLSRPGTSSYTFSLGRVRALQHADAPWFSQTTWRHGLSNSTSLYTGSIFSDGYASLMAGSTSATPLGELSADITSAWADDILDTHPDNSTLRGENYRIRYHHLLDTTNTSVALTAYRFSSEDYVSLADYSARQDDSNERNRLQMTISQPLGGWGQLDLSGIDRHYWDDTDSVTTYQLGYRHDFTWGNLRLTAGQDVKDKVPNSHYMARISIPLGSGTETPSPNTQNQPRFSTSVSDELGPNRQIHYQANASVAGEQGTALDDYATNLQWKTPATLFGIDVSREKSGVRYNSSLSGTLLAHSGGVVLSPNRGDTMVLVQPEKLDTGPSSFPYSRYISTASDQLVTGLSPYQSNSVPFETSAEGSWDISRQDIIPTRGAIIVIDEDQYPSTSTIGVYHQLSHEKEEPQEQPD